MSASFEDVSRDFRAGSGFIRRVGVTEADARVGYRWRGGAGALVESWGPSLEVQGTWDRQNFWSGLGPTESEVQLNLSASFRGNIGGSLSFSRDSYTFSAQEYEGLFLSSVENESVLPFAPATELFSGMTSVRFRGWVSRWEQARVSFGGSWSETPIFARGVPADVGNSYGGDLNLSFYPSGSLTLGVGVRHSTILRKRDGSRYSTATIPRINGRYQFSRALFVRANVEYSSQIRGDVLDPVSGASVLTCGESCIPRSGSDAHDFRLEGLLGYEPSPGTVVYVGYTREMRDAEAFGLRNFTPEADGLFVKLSYRFRM